MAGCHAEGNKREMLFDSLLELATLFDKKRVELHRKLTGEASLEPAITLEQLNKQKDALIVGIMFFIISRI